MRGIRGPAHMPIRATLDRKKRGGPNLNPGAQVRPGRLQAGVTHPDKPWEVGSYQALCQAPPRPRGRRQKYFTPAHTNWVVARPQLEPAREPLEAGR